MQLTLLRRSPRIHLLTAAAMCLAATASAQQGDLRPTWECLPEETAFAIRIPNGLAVAEAMVEETKLGAVLFSEARREKFREIVNQRGDGDEGDLATELEKYGLTPDDLPQFLAGESGYAVLVSEPQTESPLVVGLGWVEPGEDLAQRAFEAIARSLEEQEDEEHPAQRVDLELAGQTVMHVSIPVVSIEYGEFVLPDNYENLPEDEQERAWDDAYKKYEDSAEQTVSYQTMLATSLGGRLLVAHSFTEASEDEQRDVSERLEVVFERLIVAHSGEAGRFLPHVLATPGMDRVVDPEGTTLVEAYGDPARLLDLARAQPEFQADEEAEKVLSMLGADAVGPFAMRMALEGQHMHTRLFLSAPEPRTGLLRLLDQPPLPADVPAWVPATALSVSQISFDVGQAFRIIKEEVTRRFPEEAAQSFEMADAQTRNFAQVGLEELLSSLGSRHVVVSFAPEVVAQEAIDEVEVEVPQDRMAIVLSVTDDDVWARVMKAIGGFALFASELKSTDEQGFNGWRMESELMEGGLVAGKGYLVLAIGRGVLESTLSSLNNPPTGRDSLRESDLFARASQLVDLSPSMAFEITDGDRSARAVRDMLQTMFDQVEAFSYEYEGETYESESPPWLAFAQALLPDDDEIENILGPAASAMEVDADGVLIRSVNELPPPE